MEKFIVIFFISVLINELIFRIKLLPSFSGDLHQKFSSTKSVPLTGGIILLIFFTYFFFKNNELIYICFFSIFILKGFFYNKTHDSQKKVENKNCLSIKNIYYNLNT